MAREHAIVLFDGVCNLCTWSVQFIAPRDAKGYFQFASLQSPIGEELLAKYGVDRRGVDSVVLIEGGKGYVRSDAALRILHQLDGWWSLAWG